MGGSGVDYTGEKNWSRCTKPEALTAIGHGDQAYWLMCQRITLFSIKIIL